MRIPHFQNVAPFLLIAALAACSGSDVVSTARPPALGSVTALPNTTNALAARVLVQARDADSLRVLFASAADSGSTPFVPAHPGTDTLDVLGLRDSTAYTFRVEAVGSGGSARSDAASALTGSLPQWLKAYTLVTSGTPVPGYILVAVSAAASMPALVAFDGSGRVRWYRAFPDQIGVGAGEAKQQPNGHFTVFIGSTSGFNPTYGRYLELTPAGDVVASWAAPAPLYTDNHELLLTVGPDGTRAHLLGYDFRHLDMSRFGGSADALVAGHTLLRLTAGNVPEFFWSAWDHISLDDWIEEPQSSKQQSPTDFDHTNSLAIAPDGNYVVSFRNLAEVAKLDARTGGYIWRLGGAHNQFAFAADPLGGFSGEHSVRVLDNGNLLMYDNGLRHTPPETRAVEYTLDLATHTATMVWQFRHTPPIYTPFLGLVARRANGDTFIAWGGVGILDEVTPDGHVAWEAHVQLNGQDLPVYRATPVASLYRYQRP